MLVARSRRNAFSSCRHSCDTAWPAAEGAAAQAGVEAGRRVLPRCAACLLACAQGAARPQAGAAPSQATCYFCLRCWAAGGWSERGAALLHGCDDRKTGGWGPPAAPSSSPSSSSSSCWVMQSARRPSPGSVPLQKRSRSASQGPGGKWVDGGVGRGRCAGRCVRRPLLRARRPGWWRRRRGPAAGARGRGLQLQLRSNPHAHPAGRGRRCRRPTAAPQAPLPPRRSAAPRRREAWWCRCRRAAPAPPP